MKLAHSRKVAFQSPAAQVDLTSAPVPTQEPVALIQPAELNLALQLVNSLQPPVQKPDQNNQLPANAIDYNTKAKNILGKYQQVIFQVLGNTADWNTPEFANAVYNWQKNNGFSGAYLDGKLGPVTMAKMAQLVPELATSGYRPQDFFLAKGSRANSRVMGLVPRLKEIEQEHGIPLWLMIGWIQVESGGDYKNETDSPKTGFKERGLFQISGPEAKAIGIDIDRVNDTLETSLDAGVKLVYYRAGSLAKILDSYPTMANSFAKKSENYWKLVMYTFSGGPGRANQLLSAMTQANYYPKTWGDVINFIHNSNSFNLAKWAMHVERAAEIGQKATGMQSQQAQQVVASLRQRAKRKTQQIKNAFLSRLINGKY